MNHFLSYIMPCFNYADVIEQSLASIYAQNLDIPFEVICTDDCSTDKQTMKILRTWESLHNNFHVYQTSKNSGESVANNISVLQSKGDLIFCLDSDNVLALNSIKSLIECLDKTGCDGASFQELRYFKDDFKHLKSSYFKAPDNICDLNHILTEKTNPAASGNYLFTRESFDRAGGYPEGNLMGSWSFGFRQFASGSKIAILPDSFYWHRWSPKGMYLELYKKNLPQKFMQQTIDEFLNGWKGVKVPTIQYQTASRQLILMRAGNAPVVFSILARAIQFLNCHHQDVLEIGCSSGYYSEVLKYMIPDCIGAYVGIDYSPHMIKLARKKYPRLVFTVNDGASLPFPDGRFPIVISSCYLLHVLNHKEHIKETARVSSKYVIAHRTWVRKERPTYRFAKQAYGVNFLEVCFNEAEFLSWFTAAGLKLIQTFEIESDEEKDEYHYTYLFEKQ